MAKQLSYTEFAPYGPQPTDSHVGGQIGGAWRRRFARRLATGEYAVITVSFHAEERLDHGMRQRQIVRSTEYLLCRDMNNVQASVEYSNWRYETVDTHGQVDEAAAKHACSQVRADELTWSGLRRSEIDCRLVAISAGPHQIRVRCDEHERISAESWPLWTDAMRGFVCDRGHNWLFLVHVHDPEDATEPPAVGDLSTVKRAIVNVVHAAHYSSDAYQLRLWRWIREATFEPVTWRLVPGTGEFVGSGDERLPAMAYSEYEVVGADGTRYLRVTVPINGDA